MSRGGFRLNAMRLRKLRAKKRWTQEDLAMESGISDREIRRIEAGGAARCDTIALIAKAFDIDEGILIFQPHILATELLRIFSEQHRRTMHAIEKWVSPTCVLECWGGDEGVPFGGRFRGLTEMDLFVHRYFDTFDRDNGPMRIQNWYEEGESYDSVVLQAIETVTAKRKGSYPTQHSFMLTFKFDRQQRLVLCEDAFDTAKLLTQISQRTISEKMPLREPTQRSRPHSANSR